MRMIEKGCILRKYGFYRTLGLLSGDGTPISMIDFNNKILEFAYYNLFLRVKQELLDKDIISIYSDDKERKRMIKLTKNGIVLKLRIREIIEQLSSFEK